MTDELPRWNVRLNVTRAFADYGDLLSIVGQHFRTFQQIEAFLGPYNARQRGLKFYTPPTREQLRAVCKQGGMNDVTYFALLGSVIRFCENTKGTRALPTPHPSTVHSIQLPEPAFELTRSSQNATMSTHELRVPGAEPVYLSGVRSPEAVKFVILRPKLSKLGTPSPNDWEALLFNQNHGYIANWVDTSINPRWSGIYH